MAHGADRDQLTPSFNPTTQVLPAGPVVTHSKTSRSRAEAMPEGSADITRIVLSVLVIGILLAGSVWTLLPFLSGMVWATTIAVATWPLLLRLQRLAGGRRGLAVAMMTVLVLCVFIVPFALAISTLLEAADASPAVMNDFLTHGLGPRRRFGFAGGHGGCASARGCQPILIITPVKECHYFTCFT